MEGAGAAYIRLIIIQENKAVGGGVGQAVLLKKGLSDRTLKGGETKDAPPIPF